MPWIDYNTDCPGYPAAVAQENYLRTVPFLGQSEVICGYEVLPMNLEHLTWLEINQSPFLTSLPAEVLAEKPGIAGDLTTFLWIISPYFRPGSRTSGKWRRRLDRLTGYLFEGARDRFNRRFAGIVTRPDIIAACRNYVDEAFLDAKTGGGGRSNYSTAAAITAVLRKQYGFPADSWERSRWRELIRTLTGQVNPLRIPLKIAFQYLKIADRWADPNAPMENKLSDAAIREWNRLEAEKNLQPPTSNLQPQGAA